MEITVPDSVQFVFTVPRKIDKRLVGEKFPMNFSVCFTHAVKAVYLGHKVDARLTDYSRCDKCFASTYGGQRDDEYDEILAAL